MKKISAILITHNEEEKIEQALKSLQSVSDEIIVVDSHSTDSTIEICHRYTDHVIEKSWEGYRAQKQFATEQATHDWILSLDADEMLSAELKREILEWKNQASKFQSYRIARKTFFMGRWISHTTWYPDWQLRLFARSSGRWTGGRVHESFQTSEAPGRLKGQLYHYTYSSFSEYLHQLEHFSTLAAQDYLDSGKKVYWTHIGFYPPGIFLKNYLVSFGFLDGLPGLFVSLLAACSTLFKYLKAWEIQSKKNIQFPCDSCNEE